MDPLTVAGDNATAWLLMLAALVIVARRAAGPRRIDRLFSGPVMLGRFDPFGDGPDRSSFRYRQRRR